MHTRYHAKSNTLIVGAAFCLTATALPPITLAETTNNSDNYSANNKNTAALPAWTTTLKRYSIDQPAQQQQTSTLPFRTRIRGGVWLSAPTGDLRFGGPAASDVSVEDHLDLNNPQASFTGDLTLDFKNNWKRWQLWFDAFDTSQDSTTNLPVAATVNGTSLPRGTRVQSSFAATSFGAHVGYDLFENILELNEPDNVSDNPDAELRLHVIGGFRALNIDESFSAPAPGVSADYDEWHAIAEAGGRLSILVNPRESPWGSLDVSLNLLAGYGLSDGDLTTVDLFTAITWQPIPNAGFSAGYRLFDISLDSVQQSNGSNFEADVTLAGFFLGGQITF